MSNNGHFHITITENQTGAVLYNLDSDCIIGAYHQGARGKGTEVKALNATYCNLKTVLETLAGVKQVIEAIFESDANLKACRPLVDKLLSNASIMTVDATPLLARDDSEV